MHEHRRAKERIRVLEMVEDLSQSPHLTSMMFHELSKRLGGIVEQRAFGLQVMNASSSEALQFGNIIGESAKMIHRPDMRELALPKRFL